MLACFSFFFLVSSSISDLKRSSNDKSPYGWKTVLEYKHHDLAEDDEDEKKIHRAETKAARTSTRFAARGSNSQRRGSSVAPPSQVAVAHLPKAFGRLNPQLSATRSAGICFSCWKPGHWRAACPNLPLLAESEPNYQGVVCSPVSCFL